MAAVDRTLKNVVQAVSARVGNFRAWVETVENPDANMKNMIECVNDVIRKMCRVKPSPMLNATFTTPIHDNVYGDGSTDYISQINSSGLVTGISTTFTDIYALRGSYGSSERGNAVLYVIDYDIPQCSPLRVYSVYNNTSITLSDWPTAWGTLSGKTYEFSLCEDRFTMPADFSSLISASVQRYSTGTWQTLLEPKRLSEMEYIRNTIGSGGALASVYQVGTPIYVSVIEDDEYYKLQVHPMPDDSAGLYVQYIRQHKYIDSDSDYVMIPDADMDVLVSGVEALWSSFTKEGYENAYEAWQLTVLRPWAGLKISRTDATPPKLRQREEDPMSRMRF